MTTIAANRRLLGAVLATALAAVLATAGGGLAQTVGSTSADASYSTSCGLGLCTVYAEGDHAAASSAQGYLFFTAATNQGYDSCSIGPFPGTCDTDLTIRHTLLGECFVVTAVTVGPGIAIDNASNCVGIAS